MTNKTSNGAVRSPLKLTLQIKDKYYRVKSVSSTEDSNDSERESLDENNSTMTDSTNDTSLNDVGMEVEISYELSNSSFQSGSQSLNASQPEFCDELSNSIFHPPDSNNLNVNKPELCDELSNSAFHQPDSNNLNESDEQENSEPSSTTSSTSEIVKTAGKERESSEADVTAETPVVIKKEKENGEVKTEGNDPSSLQKSRDTSGKEKSPENGGNEGSNKDDDFWDTATEMAPEDATPQPAKPPAHPVISVRKAEDLMMSRAQMNGSNEECSVCCERFPSPGALEQHRSSAGHYSCTLSDDCSNAVFPSSSDLSQHQAMHHQPPVQQLAQQVQRIPSSFTSPNYRTPTPPQQRNVYMPTSPMAPYYQGGMLAHGGGGSQQIGSGVVMTSTVSSSVPNLPPGIQLSKRPAAQPPEATSPKQQRREEEGRQIRLPDSITLVSRTPPTTPPQQQRRSESVTDMLANRGITVVPSGRPASSPSSSPATSSIPRSLMNTSAISITPSSQQQPQQQHRGSNFAVPTKPVTRLLTVDLTKDSDPPPRRPIMNRPGRIRGPTGRSICQICDKAFPTPQELTQHMACHRGGGAPNAKPLGYECRECTAQYPTEAGLQAHRQKYHGAGGPSPDMAIPVVDLKQVGVLSRLAALGIRSVIPLSQLHSGSGGGMFGLPVVAVDSASNPAICNIGGLGASNLLPLGPLKNLSFNSNNMR